jgi:cytochrome c oxidase assembly protein subunit 15
MGVLFPNVAEGASEAATTVIRKTRAKALPLSALIAITALSGAYVAGMDAGRAYNTFPLMDGQWVPEEYLKDFEKLGWRNFFENTAAVQFDHRVLAMSTLIVSTAVWASSRGVLYLLPPRASLALNSTVVLVYAQVGLGIATLLNHVPVSLGVLHQANALLVFTAAVGLVHALRRGGGRAAQAVRRSVTQKNAGVGSAVHAKPR